MSIYNQSNIEKLINNKKEREGKERGKEEGKRRKERKKERKKKGKHDLWS